ncbi:hypothetical protein ACY2EW_08695 [Serratia nevei]
MDKLREEFEKWWQQEDYDNRLSNIQGVMFNRIKQGMFAAWQASRASIVVELPKAALTSEFRGDNPEYRMMAFDVKESIRSIGLSIKGE